MVGLRLLQIENIRMQFMKITLISLASCILLLSMNSPHLFCNYVLCFELVVFTVGFDFAVEMESD